jgi:ABC-type antimicrobial peptide transport system permease subunit
VIGLYSVISYQVTQRTREIGIRMALGAEQHQILKLFLRRATTMGVVGIALGLPFAEFMGRAAAAAVGMPQGSLLLTVLLTFGMFLTVIAAAAIPAHRASRIDPLKTLRWE